ncbi:Mobile element protein [Geobacillus proteiniphilus]|uniref:Mobile element protein n=1 Tax=Geobacillus proteiniphilus TaxID=860353 RepID=A0A1Q5SV35_9BACL|nr:Mobile element protein [Geobacillus proteiniphilus]
MPTITLKLELYKPTKAKQEMYEKMSDINTQFANWLLNHPELNQATSKLFKAFSSQRFPSAIACQTIRDVKFQRMAEIQTPFPIPSKNDMKLIDLACTFLQVYSHPRLIERRKFFRPLP